MLNFTTENKKKLKKKWHYMKIQNLFITLVIEKATRL